MATEKLGYILRRGVGFIYIYQGWVNLFRKRHL